MLLSATCWSWADGPLTKTEEGKRWPCSVCVCFSTAGLPQTAETAVHKEKKKIHTVATVNKLK